MKRLRPARPGFACCLAILAAGCSFIEPVAAWEKGTLAKPEMGFDAARFDARYDEHIYTSREAAPAASGVGGGGCGCN